MFSLAKRSWLLYMLGLTALVLAGPRGRAQTSFRSGLTQPQFNNVAALSSLYGSIGAFGLNPSAGLGSLASLSSNPYGAGSLGAGAYGGGTGQNPYGTYYEDPNGAYLRGSAQVLDSQGRLMVSQQQAYVLREQARSQRIATDRKAFDEYLYEREKTPTAEEERRRLRAQSVQRARNNPPVTEIWSGKALNDLLQDLQTQPLSAGSAERGSLAILDGDGLKHINVTKGAGNIGLLKNEGRLHWPTALAGSDYAPKREGLAALVQEALRQVEFNSRVEAGTIRQLTVGLDKLRTQLRKNGRDLSAAEYIEAKKFLADFDDAVTALRQGDVANQVTGQALLKAKTVRELVKQMTEQGLQFAPAVAGDESAYLALHQRLVEHDLAAQSKDPEDRAAATPLAGAIGAGGR
jgi:hypothetical protein